MDFNIYTQKVVLSNDKKIDLLIFYRNDIRIKKKHMLSMFVSIDDNIISESVSDTILFFEELKMFEQANEQNKFFKKVQQDKKNSLLCKLFENKIYLSKIEASAIYQMFNMYKNGYSPLYADADEFYHAIKNNDVLSSYRFLT